MNKKMDITPESLKTEEGINNTLKKRNEVIKADFKCFQCLKSLMKNIHDGHLIKGINEYIGEDETSNIEDTEGYRIVTNLKNVVNERENANDDFLKSLSGMGVENE